MSPVVRGLACVIEVSGELTLTTEREFTDRVAEAVAASQGSVLFDLSGLDFVDCRGARALARAAYAVPSRRPALYGCNPVVRRVLEALGLDLPYRPVPDSRAQTRPRPREDGFSRGETLVAMARATKSNARRSALYGSEVMSRLAATYSELALNSRYRAQRKSEDRGRLLALSGRARDLSRQYMRHVTSDAG